MTLPLEKRAEVPCARCGYRYRWALLDSSRCCRDRGRCDSNLARQERYRQARGRR